MGRVEEGSSGPPDTHTLLLPSTGMVPSLPRVQGALSPVLTGGAGGGAHSFLPRIVLGSVLNADLTETCFLSRTISGSPLLRMNPQLRVPCELCEPGSIHLLCASVPSSVTWD